MRLWRTVILDADSTLAGIEGIDWLAAQRGPAIAARVADATTAAMEGRQAIEQVYAARLALVAPTRAELDALGRAYVAAAATDAARVIAAGRARGIRWIIVSGGPRPALLHLAAALGIPAEDVHAVEIYHDAAGAYAGFDSASPLTRQGGKPDLVAALTALERPMLALGDGNTDAELRRVSDAFWCFTGFVQRPSVVARAERSISSFAELEHALFG